MAEQSLGALAPALNRTCANCGGPAPRRDAKKRDGTPADHAFCSRACYDAFRVSVREDRRVDCVGCGTSFIPAGKRSAPLQKYCSMVCRVVSKKATAKHCVNCGCWFTPIKWMKSRGRYVSHNGAKTCSRECYLAWISNNAERKRKISIAFSGPCHPNWRGGGRGIGYRGPGWTKIAERVRRRDNYRCVDCGLADDECLARYGRRLDVDHVVPFHNFLRIAEANRTNNLASRCASCHRRAEALRPRQMTLALFEGGGHKRYARGERHPRAKITETHVVEIRRRYERGESLSSIARVLGISRGSVVAAAKRITWKCVA